MADKRYDEFPAGSADPTQIILTADPGTGELGKIPLSDLAPDLQAVTDVGSETDNLIFAGNGISIAPSMSVLFNLDAAGNYKANGWGGVIRQDISTGNIYIQATAASGTAGGGPSYGGVPFQVLPNGTVQMPNYGDGSVTGTPTRLAAFDVDGKVIEVVQPKKYVALLTQSGSSAPAATIFENTIGAIVWTRNSAGNYTGTLSAAFVVGKTWLVTGTLDIMNVPVIEFIQVDANSVNIQVTINTTPADDSLPSNGLSIEIRVYP